MPKSVFKFCEDAAKIHKLSMKTASVQFLVIIFGAFTHCQDIMFHRIKNTKLIATSFIYDRNVRMWNRLPNCFRQPASLTKSRLY